MGFISFLTEQMYIMFSIFYFEVFILKNNVIVGRFIQALSFNPDFIVDFQRKLAFPIIKNVGFIKGHKIVVYYHQEQALPLKEVEEVKIDELNSGLVKITKTVKLTGSTTPEEKKKAEPVKMLNEYNFPPHLIFELFNAHFVTKIASKGKTTDWGLVVIVICAVIFLIAFMAIMVFGVLKGG